MNSKICLEEARIHAHICGDGTITISRGRRSPKELISHPYKNIWRKTYRIRYFNNEKVLRKEFAADVKKVYKKKAIEVAKNEVTTSAKWVCDRLKQMGAGKTYEWRIGKEIKKGTKINKRVWIRAFFDDEAYVDIKNKRITVKCMNIHGLKDIKGLLKNINIKSKITGPNCDKSWYLRINGIDNLKVYKSKVGFKIPRKIKSLSAIPLK